MTAGVPAPGGGVVGAIDPVMVEQSTGRGARGIVVAAAPGAAAIGSALLRSGGNAYDAVVAALLAESVLLPPKCGLAGDLVALTLGPGEQAPSSLLAIGGAPRRLADEVRRRGSLADTGPLSVGVPGAPAGYAALAERATQPLSCLAAPAIALARDGFAWAPICATLAIESQQLVDEHNPAGTRYYPSGRPLAPGELVSLPGLVRVMEAFVARGERLFQGRLGELVAERVQAAGGVIDVEDFELADASWSGCPSRAIGRSGWRVYATPAPTHGVSLLDAVSALADRSVAGDVLRSVTAAEARRDRPGLVGRSDSTSMVSAADSVGNVVVAMHSNSYPRFGSGLIVDELDLILSNRAGRGFTPVPGHPNFPNPGQRPSTTLHLWAAGYRGEISHLGGTPGGVNQMCWNAQTLRNLFAGETAPGALTVAPRWEKAAPGAPVPVEEGLSTDDVDSLRCTGEVVEVPRWGLRSATQVIRRPVPGSALIGGVDPRTGGLALGV
ncbi:MAG: gamma-glutamyltransferase [Ilumatobacteraceae bacterium]